MESINVINRSLIDSISACYAYCNCQTRGQGINKSLNVVKYSFLLGQYCVMVSLTLHDIRPNKIHDISLM
jgi:hypothetical protein